MSRLTTIQNIQPASTIEGKHWINQDTGQAYVYLNGDWRPFASGDSWDVYRVPLTIFIDGVDRTPTIEIDSFIKKDILTNEVDTCDFAFYDYYNNSAIDIGQDVQVWYRESLATTPERIFGGEIIECPKQATAPGIMKFLYEVRCVDYSRKLKKKLAVEVYENQLAGNIIKDLISKYDEDGITTNNVANGITVNYIAFNYQTIYECIREICDITGYDWYVDYDKDLHFFSSLSNTAPYNLTEDPETSGHYKGLRIEVDKSQLRNAIYVRGGTYLSEVSEQIRVADGSQLTFNLDYRPFEPIKVYVNKGTGYVEKTLGIDNIDKTGKDFVLNFNEKVIKNLDHPTLSAGDLIKITYRYEIEVLTYSTDDDSIAELKAIEGGDGIYEYVIKDTTIGSITGATERANAELRKYANPIINGNFWTDQYGYRSGQYILLELPSWNYNSRSFLIHDVTTTLGRDNKLKQEINFATTLKGINDFLLYLFDSGKQIIVRDNEVVHNLIKRKESVIITDSTPTYDTWVPRKWGVWAERMGKWSGGTANDRWS